MNFLRLSFSVRVIFFFTGRMVDWRKIIKFMELFFFGMRSEGTSSTEVKNHFYVFLALLVMVFFFPAQTFTHHYRSMEFPGMSSRTCEQQRIES